MDIKKVAILGGGTAGWLTANHLGKALIGQGISITVIESPDIPTIGVGEGTVPMMRETLKYFGISESQFIKECDATFKQSIKFVNWLDKTAHGEGNFYHHLFDFPFPNNRDLTPFWLRTQHKSFAQTVSFQANVCEAKKAPKKISTPEYVGETTYAYHLNAKKFAELLQNHAVNKFSVAHQVSTVIDATVNNTDIELIVTDTHGEQVFDFYVDCSGFNCYLLGKKLNIPFVDMSHKLPIDKAITAQIPTEDDAEIPPYTIATAHEAGWIWDIALKNRRGTGFVYSSNYLSDDEAKQKFERYLGQSLEGIVSRVIPMKIGYREQFWQGNCVAIGLSQGFVEPLEATAILVTDFCARHLAERFPRSKSELLACQSRFNRNVKYAWDRVIDFIQLHYYLSDRQDSAFWLDWKNVDRLSDELKQKLAIWQNNPPLSTDFFSKFEVFDVENYLYVLYGMHYLTKPSYIDAKSFEQDQILAQQVEDHSQKLIASLPSHRELIDKLARFEFSKL
ncbi:tryptophan halogenase family protein [Pseudoalteromonas tunicata]|uniref:tryptophan halogenase family protein n=1 Tax=Pseudoalteromonas tunicata TaxID=314281 RepID=UPI00273D3BE5|nr:tryptophan halogenase family protein [Pseudoalteromonas tunicata]MDP4985499.1 tryptophan 7-halogenase [Pseudoalteromonas tunicata]